MAMRKPASRTLYGAVKKPLYFEYLEDQLFVIKGVVSSEAIVFKLFLGSKDSQVSGSVAHDIGEIKSE